MSNTNIQTVSFEADRTVIIEGGKVQLLTFNLSEPAPPGGLVVDLQIDDPDGESGPGDTEFPPELITNIVDFGQVEEDGTITASLTIAEGATEATFGISAFEDEQIETGETYSLTLLETENYIADPNSTTITTTIEDNMTSPTVSIAPENVSVTEGEIFAWNITLDTPAPAGGLALSLPIIANNDPAPGDVEYNIDGSSGIADFEFVLGEDVSESFNLTIAEGETEAVLISQAISDDLAEEDEIFTTAIAEGSGYSVNPDQSQVTTTISDTDTSVDLPTVSLTAEPSQVNEGEQLEFNFDLTEPVAEGGLVVDLDLLEDTDPLPGDISYFVEGSENITNFELIVDEESGLIDGATVTLAEGATSATLLSDIIADNATEGEESITFSLAESDEYSINSEVNAASFTILDTSTDISTNVPTVSITPENVSVIEGETFAWNISLSQPAPAGGLALSLPITFNNDPAPGDVEYNIDGSSGITDFEFIAGDGVSESFNLTIAEGETEAVLVSQAISDDLAEEDEIFTTAIAEGDGYLVDSNQNEITTTLSDADLNPTVDLSTVFGTTEADTIELDGNSQLVFAGDSNDLIDASFGSEGGNRIYGGNGNDTVILGEKDRIFGGEGDDQFFATSGGNNTITGGAGTDQFWIAVASISESANTITDFTLGEDVIGITGLGIGFEDLTITQTDADVLIAASGSDLAVLTDIDADSLSNNNFAFG